MNLNEQLSRIKEMMGLPNQTYYRSVDKFLGEKVMFTPQGYHEKFDDQGNPVFTQGDVIARSEEPELAASKTIGGAALGLWSMLHHYGKLKNAIYIYTISENPDKDLSHVKHDDFEYLQEVRYKRPVEGIYLGQFNYDDDFNDGADILYTFLTSEPWDEFSDSDTQKRDTFLNQIKTISKTNLHEDEQPINEYVIQQEQKTR